MSKARLVIEGLCKSYASPVLTDVNLSIDEGEIHALVGENGAGKTTLVNILTGIVEKGAGRIELNDRYPSRRRRRASHFPPASPSPHRNSLSSAR